MYAQRGGINGGPPPELSNNPFIEHPSNALSRYPDINGTDAPSGTNQFTSWLQPSSPTGSAQTGYSSLSQPSSNGYDSAYQAPQQTGWQGSPYAQQQGGYGGAAYGGGQLQVQPTGVPFQPSSSFGQQLSTQLTAAGYGSQISQQPQQLQQPQYTGYQASPQYASSYGYGQTQPQYTGAPPANIQYPTEFDPYSQQQAQTQAQTAPGTSSQYRSPHPRDFVQQNKPELEAWDTYAWKQALNSFDALKEAWATRKKEISARVNAFGGQGLFGGGGGYGYQNYGQAQELARLEQLAKEADSNVDVAAAASFQMQEVQSGYRQSGDMASKKRVRESINAALQSLPDWPPQNW